MIATGGRRIPFSRLPVFDARYRAGRDADERRATHDAGAFAERLSLAERIERALLEDERLHGD